MHYKFKIGDIIQVVHEEYVGSKINKYNLEYYSKFYDNNLFNQYGIITNVNKIFHKVFIDGMNYTLDKDDLLVII